MASGRSGRPKSGTGTTRLKPVGVSDDGTALILGTRSNAKTGGYRLAIDEALLLQLEEARRRIPSVPDVDSTVSADVAAALDDLAEAGADLHEAGLPNEAEDDRRAVSADGVTSIFSFDADDVAQLETERSDYPDDVTTRGDLGISALDPASDLEAARDLAVPEDSVLPVPEGASAAFAAEADDDDEDDAVPGAATMPQMDPDATPEHGSADLGEPEPPLAVDAGDGAAGSRAPSARVQSKLSPKEIQNLLRQGRKVTTIAKKAGVDPEWIQRFETPIVWERVGMAERAQKAVLTRARLGDSGAPLAQSVMANLKLRRIRMTTDQLREAWDSTRHPKTGKWTVSFSFPGRGRVQKGEWEFDPDTGEIHALNKLAADLGWVKPRRRRSAAE